MNPIISTTTNNGHPVLVNINHIATVWANPQGGSYIKLNTFTAPNTNDLIYSIEGVSIINAKIQAAFVGK